MRETHKLRLCMRLSCRRDARTKTKTACILNFTLFRVTNCALLSFLINLFLYIRFLHISHNAPCLPPKIVHNLALFSISLGTSTIPRRNEKQRLYNILGANKVHYGRCARGVHFILRIYLIIFIKSFIYLFFTQPASNSLATYGLCFNLFCNKDFEIK